MACQGLFSVHAVLSREDLKRQVARYRKANRNLAEQLRYYKKQCAAQKHKTRRDIQALLQKTYAAIADIVVEWEYQLKKKDLDDTVRMGRMELILDRHLGSENDLGEMGEVMNLAFDHIMDRMQQEKGIEFTIRDKKLFCYMVTRMVNESVRILLKLNCASTAGTQKNRLKQKISHYTVQGRKEYLDLIDKNNK